MEKRLEMVIIKHHKDEKARKPVYKLPYETEANAFMPDDFDEYIKKYGYHFTEALAEHISKMMENRDGTQHTWSSRQVEEAIETLGLTVPADTTIGDITYLANMYYADLYPDVLKEEVSCLKAAHLIANDPDGYDGMIFCRWISDAIGKSIEIDWKKFM